MEKSFSVAVEMEDGQKRTLTVQGPSSGSAFQQVKAMAGVRRVGRVAEVGADGRVAPPSAAPSAGREQKADEGQHPTTPTSVFMGTGPRVVVSARQGGEQPFKNLYIPPERLAVPKPTPPPQPVVKAPVAPPARVAPVVTTPATPEVVEEPVTSSDESATAPTSLEYRIVKSRRQSGEPYILQRGEWHEQKGKRVFSVDWEKGFADREKAEAHHQWMQQIAAEMAQVGELEVEEVDA